ncbi:MAG: amidohydrolase family protein [Solirubrobacterales bacterium]
MTVADGSIVAVGAGAVSPTDGRDIDCSGLFLMPGVFDCHCHLDFESGSLEEQMGFDATRWALEVARNGRLLLDLGITSVRDVGASTPGIRDGFAAGAVPGPALHVSGPPIGQTGGHTDGYIPSTGTEAITGFMVPEYAGRPPYLVDGVDEMRKAIRQQLRSGVDWIKVMTTGGLLSSVRDHPLKPELTEEEVAVAVSEAARAGIPVAAHAYGGEGLDLAVRAGVRSIEHGIFLSEEQAAEMARRECWLVPTLVVVHELAELADAGELDARSRGRIAEILPDAGRQVAVAKEAGVKIALGTDMLRQGPNLREIPLLAAAGLTPAESLLAATAGGAELCGVDDRGRLAAGQAFDAIILDEDPSNLEAFNRPEAVTGVFQNGNAVKPHERWAP